MKKIYLIILGLTLIVVFINVYFLPFFPWPLGIVRPWLILHGWIPYKDFVWSRTPIDLFALAFWYKIFGVSLESYRSFVYFSLTILTLLMWIIPKLIRQKYYLFSFLFYSFFLFPLFLNTEENEILVAIFNLLLFFSLYQYYQKRNKALLIVAGILSSLSLLTKQNSAAVIISSLISIAADSYLNKGSAFLAKIFQQVKTYSIGFLIPILGISIYFLYNHGFSYFFYYTVLFILGPYHTATSDMPTGDGILMLSAYAAIFIAYIIKVIKKKTDLLSPQKILLPLLILGLIPSIMPSYLSYRLFTSFPLIAICFGYLMANSPQKKYLLKNFLFVLIPLFVFMAFTFSYFISYYQFVKDNGLVYGAYVKDYGEDQEKVSEWIRNNTSTKDTIMDYSNEIGYFLSNRLPTNKYLFTFSYFLLPYDKTFKVFLDEPPKAVVYDETLATDHKDFLEWPFIPYMKTHYAVRFKSGSLTVYQPINK